MVRGLSNIFKTMLNHAGRRLLLCLVAQSVCVRARIVGRGLFYAIPNFPFRARRRVAISRAVRSSRFKDIAEFIFRLDGGRRGREAHAFRSPARRRDPATCGPKSSRRISHHSFGVEECVPDYL